MSGQGQDDLSKMAWSAIRAAQKASPDDTARRQCLEYLLTTYREPVKALVRAWGIRDDNKVEDRVQEYFTRFLEKGWLDQLDQARGSFRGFLRVSVRHFLLNEHDKSARRPAQVPIGKTDDSTVGTVPQLASSAPGPEEEYDRCWARTLMAQAVAEFQKKCESGKRTHYHAVFERHVLNPEAHGDPTYRQTAEALGIAETDVANCLHRSKILFAEIVRNLIRQTVSADGDIEQEIAELQRYFR